MRTTRANEATARQIRDIRAMAAERREENALITDISGGRHDMMAARMARPRTLVPERRRKGTAEVGNRRAWNARATGGEVRGHKDDAS